MKGTEINMGKTKLMLTLEKAKENSQSGRWPCGCCQKGAGANAVLCTVCDVTKVVED